MALTALGALLFGGILTMNGLVACSPRTQAAAADTRPVNSAEAARLAGVRLVDYRTGHVGVRVTIGSGANAVHFTGWVDWRRPLIYLNSLGQSPGPADGLLQAIPGVVAVRPGRYIPAASAHPSAAAIDPFPAPPVQPPPTGWQIRPITPGSPVDTMIALLFALRSPAADDPAQIAAIGTQFVDTDEIGGVPVDVLDGAAVPPAKPAAESAKPTPSMPSASSSAALPFAAHGGQVRYWVDAQSRLLRAEALVDPKTMLRIDFDRTDPVTPQAIELLGGAAITPAKPTAAQITALSLMRVHDYVAGGGAITVAMPLASNALLTAVGWIDWRDSVIYVAVHNNKGSGPDATLRADAAGVTQRGTFVDSPASNSPPASRPSTSPSTGIADPPLHPSHTGWKRTSWIDREDAYGETDLDAILNELLALAAPVIDSPVALKPIASRLRTDTLGRTPVTVYEIRKPSEQALKPGNGRLRYWLDKAGYLRRLELRTRNGSYGYVTINPGPVPTLPDPIPASARPTDR
jgi:hypothetical protein